MRNSVALVIIYMLAFTLPGFSQERLVQSGQHPAFGERVAERKQMVKDGIENYPYKPVRNPDVLKAMRHVPRHVFVHPDFRHEAYLNTPLLIGHNQTISQPFIVAHMTELLDIKQHHRILEVGTGSGYQAAVLGELCDHVYTIEIISALGMKAESLLKELGYTQIQVRIGDGYNGWPDAAPFDRIIVTCAPDDIPQPLLDQLALGGRIVIPVGKQDQTQYMVVVVKEKNGRISQKCHYPVRFVPMTGKASE